MVYLVNKNCGLHPVNLTLCAKITMKTMIGRAKMTQSCTQFCMRNDTKRNDKNAHRNVQTIYQTIAKPIPVFARVVHGVCTEKITKR